MALTIKFSLLPVADSPSNGEQENKYDETSIAAADQAAARTLKQLDADANSGDPKAQCKLAVVLLSGDSPNYSEAQYLFTLATLRRLPVAQYNLGAMFANGMGVEKNPVKAVDLFMLAAEGGNAKAQYHLGYAFHHGWGIDIDIAAAMKWYAKASAQGYAKAQAALAELNAVDAASSSIKPHVKIHI